MIAAQRAAGTVAQAGYMKVYDPAFELAQRAVGEIRFVQVNHLHSSNNLHLRQFDLRRFDGYPAAAAEQTAAARKVAARQALGDATPEVQRAFSLLSGSMIHDLYTMRAMLGLPDAVVSAEIWQDGRAVTFTLPYPEGWIDGVLPLASTGRYWEDWPVAMRPDRL